MNNQPKLSTTPHTPTLQWHGGTDGTLEMIDQTRLPTELVPLMCGNVETVWEAIRSLRVRGAPAIGIAAAYGVCLGLQTVKGQGPDAFFTRLREVVDYLASSRPTAVNLFWALDRMKRKAESLADQLDPAAITAALLCEAQAIELEDQQMCRAIGRVGAELLQDGMGVLTHCNAGGLATADYGTALAVFFSAHEAGKRLHVAAPSSTFDLSLPTGDSIPIEQRDPREITHGFGRQTAPDGVAVYNPAFDVTPAHLIRALITERGLITPVTTQQIAHVLGS